VLVRFNHVASVIVNANHQRDVIGISLCSLPKKHQTEEKKDCDYDQDPEHFSRVNIVFTGVTASFG
jgi:hypothetical protein